MANEISLRILHDTSLDCWIRDRHYLKSVPAGAKIRMCFYNRQEEIIGGMLWGHPTARKLNQQCLLEFTRMFFVNDTPPFVESQALGMARKHIRRYFPQIKGLISYSSTGEGHEGIVYQADNWYPLGVTRSAGWQNRKGRIDRDLSDKIRWTRSP